MSWDVADMWSQGVVHFQQLLVLFFFSVQIYLSSSQPVPYYATLVLTGDYDTRPDDFETSTVGTIAVHYGRSVSQKQLFQSS